MKNVFLTVIIFITLTTSMPYKVRDYPELSKFIQYPILNEVATVVSPPDSLDKFDTTVVPNPKLSVNNLGGLKLSVYNSDYTIPQDYIDRLNSIVKNYPNLKIGAYAISLKDYTCIGYNESCSIDSASTVKGPFALFVMKEIAKGTHTLDEKLTYTREFYCGGSGEVQNYKFGTEFTIDELINFMLNCSDNIAFLMLQSHFGYEGYNEMVSSLGCSIWLNGVTKWGKFTAEELAVIWNEIYNFSLESQEGEYLLELLINAQYNFIKSSLGRYAIVAHKSGFNPLAYGDASIIFANSDNYNFQNTPNDYILVIMTSPGNSGYNKSCLRDIAILYDDIMRDLKNYQG